MKASSILEPQQFGSWLHEPFLARASEPGAEQGRHALGAFLTLRLADRFRPEEEPAHPLALAYQIRATRDYLLDLHPQTPEVTHLLEVVRLADAVQKRSRRSMLWPPLLAYAHWLEQELRLEEALDTVETTLGLNDDTARTEEIAALLQRGRILRQLGRFDEARASYQAGRTKAAQTGDTHSELLGRIGDAIVMRQLGNLPASEKALKSILQDASAKGDMDAQARAHHDLAVALMYRGHNAEAVPHYYAAFEFYEQSSDKVRALSDVGEALKRIGHYQASKDAFSVVLRKAASAQTRVTSMIALLELCAMTGDRVGFARLKREISAIADELPPERHADFYLLLGQGQAGFGDRRSAAASLRKAVGLAEQYQLNEYAFRARAALQELGRLPARGQGATDAPARARRSKEFQEVTRKLEALRAG